MKNLLLLAVLLFLTGLPALAEDVINADTKLPNIFIWALPEDLTSPQGVEESAKAKKKNKEVPVSDVQQDNVFEPQEEEPVVLNATTLKGYAEYVEDAEDVYLMDDHTQFTLNLKTPQKVTSQKIVDDNKIVPKMDEIYSISKFKGEEYSISPTSRNVTVKDGGWSAGTTFSSGISTSQLENTTGLFTRYENKHFAISSAYAKNNMTTRGLTTDSFYVVPEFRLNSIFAVQEVLSADITRNRRSSELVLSVNPLGKKGIDRMNFEVGAKQTFDMNSGDMWSQFRFSTKFKL